MTLSTFLVHGEHLGDKLPNINIVNAYLFSRLIWEFLTFKTWKKWGLSSDLKVNPSMVSKVYVPDRWACFQSSSDDPGVDNRGTQVPLVSDGEAQKPFVRLKFVFAVF